MKNLWLVAVIGLVLVGLTVCVRAGGTGSCAAACGSSASTDVKVLPLADIRPLQRATDLLNVPIRSPEGDLHGRITDIVLTEDRARVDFVTVAFDETRAMVYRVPFADLRTTAEGKTVFCEVTREGLGALPSFARTAWPENLDTRRVSHLLTLKVEDVGGEPAGHIRDLLIRSTDGMVTEATVSVGGFLGFRESFASIEWGTVAIAEGNARLGITSQRLQELAYRPNEYWQSLGFRGEMETGEHPMGVGAPVEPRPAPLGPDY